MNLHGPSSNQDRNNDDFRTSEQKSKMREYMKERLAKTEAVPEEFILSSIFKGLKVYFQGLTHGFSDYHLKQLIKTNGGHVRFVHNEISLSICC